MILISVPRSSRWVAKLWRSACSVTAFLIPAASTASWNRRLNWRVTLPKPMTSGAKAAGRFGKQDFVYIATDDVYLCPAGERLTYRFTNEEEGKTLRRYWTTACQTCALKAQCTT